jgi:hypothetical protein
VVRNATKLRDFVEGVGNEAVDSADTSSEDSSNLNVDFEVLKLSPILGDNKFKLEIGTRFLVLNVFSLTTFPSFLKYIHLQTMENLTPKLPDCLFMLLP